MSIRRFESVSCIICSYKPVDMVDHVLPMPLEGCVLVSLIELASGNFASSSFIRSSR